MVRPDYTPEGRKQQDFFSALRQGLEKDNSEEMVFDAEETGVGEGMEDEKELSIDTEEILARIREHLREKEESLKRRNQENTLLYEKIKEAVSERKWMFSDHPFNPNELDVGIPTENGLQMLQIALRNNAIILILHLPFKVQCNAMALMTLYIAEFNADKLYGKLSLDLKDGEITMDMAYPLEKVENFNAEDFLTCIDSLYRTIDEEKYQKMIRLSVGKVSKEDMAIYLALVRTAVDVINGEEDNENDIVYGTKQLKEKLEERRKRISFFKDPEEHLFDFEEEDDEDEDEDDGEDDEDDGISINVEKWREESGLGKRVRVGEEGYEEYRKTRHELQELISSLENKVNSTEDELNIPFEDVLADSCEGVE